MSSSQSSSRGRKHRSTSRSNTKPSTNTTITTTTTTRSTGPYNRNFQQNLIDGGVYPDGYEYPDGRAPPQPGNLQEIHRRLSQPRPSLSPSKFSDEEFRKFKRADAHASKEKQITTSVIPIIEGEIGDAKCVSGGIPFTNLYHLTDGTLVPGNPDIYYGARPEQLDRQVRDELSKHIIPSTQEDLPVAPNFFLEVKGPDGSAAVARRQASYHVALGARGIHSLRSYGQEEPDFDNNAYTISSIYHDGTLKMYTSHPSQPTSSEDRPEYPMNQVKGWSMTSDLETFRQGATYYRNGRDWAKEQRNEAIELANERAGESQAGVLPIEASFGQASSFASEVTLEEDYTLSQESGTLLDEGSNTTTNPLEGDVSSTELLLEYKLPAKRSIRHSKRSRQSQRGRRNKGGPDDDGYSH